VNAIEPERQTLADATGAATMLHGTGGNPPAAEFVIQDLRIERAVHLLKTSKLTVDRIAEQVGYADGHTLPTLLRRRIGKGVRELRAS
jgi:AraC-like DNA-binding protein